MSKGKGNLGHFLYNLQNNLNLTERIVILSIGISVTEIDLKAEEM